MVLNTYKQLKTEFERKVKELQDKCLHKQTKWCEEWWAIAHSTGNEVKICVICNKILDKLPLSDNSRKIQSAKCDCDCHIYYIDKKDCKCKKGCESEAD